MEQFKGGTARYRKRPCNRLKKLLAVNIITIKGFFSKRGIQKGMQMRMKGRNELSSTCNRPPHLACKLTHFRLHDCNLYNYGHIKM